MVYYTGDIHGKKQEIIELCERFELTEEDIVVILGDVGANYYESERDKRLKQALSRLKPTIFCIHGNHEIRPANIPSYRTKNWSARP